MVPPKGQMMMVQQRLMAAAQSNDGLKCISSMCFFFTDQSSTIATMRYAHTPYLLQCLALDVKLSNQDLSIHFLVSLCAASIHEEYSGSNVEYSEAARAMCLNMTG